MTVRILFFAFFLGAAAAAGRLRASHPSFHSGTAALSANGATHTITCIQTEISRAVVARDDIVAVCNTFLAVAENGTAVDEAAWNATIAACDRMLTSGAGSAGLATAAFVAVLVATLQGAR